jgi:hypothetical protein
MNKVKLINYGLLFFIFFMAVHTAGSQVTNDNNIPKLCNLKLSDKHSILFEKKKLDEKFSVIIDSLKLKNVKNKTQPPQQKTKIHPVRLSLLLGGMFTGWLGMHIYYSQTWWKNRAHYFKFDEDPYYARNVDKLSHVYTANLISTSSSILFGWTGLNQTLSIALGATTAIAYETYIEINDGFSPDWGFDWGDMAGNFIGALYPVAQHFVKPLQTVNIKWSFKPAWLEKKLRNYPDLLDDYTSMKFWITFNPYDLLSKKIQKYYPSFLGLGLGVTLQNASHVTGTSNAFRDFYLAFDIDITKLPGNTDFLIALKKILNFYHIPTPGVKFTHGAVWYGLLF